MPTATPQQIQQALKYTMTGSLVNGAAVLTDATPYGGIGIAPPSTVLVLLQIFDPTGNLFYQNANWNAGTFGSPDLQPIAGSGAGYTTYSFTMPVDINGNYLTGQYTINLQVQIVQNGITTVVQNTQYATICNCCNGITLNVTGNVSYNTAQVSVTDNTQYGSYVALTRVLTLYAPPTAGQAAQVGNNVTTLLWVPPANTFPSTGTWTWKLASTITYIDNVTQAQTTCEITSIGTFDVIQSQLCTVLCQLEEWRNAYWQLAALKDTTQLTINYGLAINEFALAIQSQLCGAPQSQINKHVCKIYEITGIDPNCPCSCNNGTGQPLVPTNAINGTNGTNGSNFLQGAGVPAGSLGNVGDSYLNSSTGNIYKKTGATTWTQTENIIGPAGAAGAVVLYNGNTNNNNGTTHGSYVTVDSYQVPLDTLVNNGDELKVHTSFYLGTQAAVGTNLCRLTFDGVNIWQPNGAAADIDFFSSYFQIDIDVRIARVGNTEILFETYMIGYSAGGVQQQLFKGRAEIGYITGLNLTTTAYTIAAQGQSGQNTNVNSECLEILYIAA